jgi:6-pyruvoyltetrahydropterin/6-carboxytetrahydropterin synthase
MYRLSVYDWFSSAHQLKGYRGKCEAVHGHNWKVEVEVEGESLNDVGLLIDFIELKKILKDIIDPLDHVLLNNVDGFQEANPSSERIARHVYLQMKDRLPAGIGVSTVIVWESENAKAVYCES